MGTNGWSVVVGSAIENARKRAGLSAVQLSARTGDYGTPIHRVAISKIESGTRDITITELAAIAAALEVPPIALLVPNPLEQLEIFPGFSVNGTEALGWITGVGTSYPLHAGEEGHDPQTWWAYCHHSSRPPEYKDAADAMRLVEIEEALKAQGELLDNLKKRTPEYPTMSASSKAIRTADVDHAEHVMQLIEDDWMDLVEELGRRHGGTSPAPLAQWSGAKDRLNQLKHWFDSDDADV